MWPIAISKRIIFQIKGQFHEAFVPLFLFLTTFLGSLVNTETVLYYISLSQRCSPQKEYAESNSSNSLYTQSHKFKKKLLYTPYFYKKVEKSPCIQYICRVRLNEHAMCWVNSWLNYKYWSNYRDPCKLKYFYEHEVLLNTRNCDKIRKNAGSFGIQSAYSCLNDNSESEFLKTLCRLLTGNRKASLVTQFFKMSWLKFWDNILFSLTCVVQLF